MMMKSEKIGCIVTMLMALLVLSCTSEDTLSSTNSDSVPVSLAMNVSTNRISTRMTEEMTLQTVYRGIQDQRLFPFATNALEGNLIASGKQPLSTYITNLNKYNEEVDNLHYFDDRSVKIPSGTVAFLCYCRAIPSSGSKFENGSLISNIIKESVGEELDWSNSSTSTSDIKFEPEKICNSNDVDERASNIANYLTSIAQAIQDTSGKEDLYRLFTNGSSSPDAKNHTHLLACSSTNVMQLAAWMEEQGVEVPTFDSEENNYPAAIHLPDGVAVVKWDDTQMKFVPQTATTTETNINNLNRFVYPPELYYYANSRIKTSRESRKADYANKSWADVLDAYDEGYGEMDMSTKSVAVIDPLSYAVGCLQVGLNVQSTLEDAGGTTITLNDGKTEGYASFPLTAVLISSQFAQGYDFTPKGEADEHIIYDKMIGGNISMGGSIVATPTTPSQFTNTLVLQTEDNESVRFALEFENNSGRSFEGCNGTVFNGTKFYLVGQIQVPTEKDDKDYKYRVFTKNHITKGVVKISSLKDAYTYLPDLLDPRLEVGIQLIPSWIQSTTTNVPL